MVTRPTICGRLRLLEVPKNLIRNFRTRRNRVQRLACRAISAPAELLVTRLLQVVGMQCVRCGVVGRGGGERAVSARLSLYGRDEVL